MEGLGRSPSGNACDKELMVCQGCLKLIKLDYSLQAGADVSLMGLSKLAKRDDDSDEAGTSYGGGMMGISAKSKSMSNLTAAAVLGGEASPLRASHDDAFRVRSVSFLRGSRAGSGSRLAAFNKMASLFSEASEATAVEQPLCRDCFKRAEAALASRIGEMKKHCGMYRSALASIEQRATGSGRASPAPLAVPTAVVPARDREEEGLEQEVRQLEAQLVEARAARIQWKEREQRAERLQEVYLRARNALVARGAAQSEMLHAAAAAVQRQALHMQRLARASVLNEVFHIWHEGHFGCINGLRLGRLPAVQVDWTEINACWGLAVSLLRALADALGVRFAEWQPQPGGVTSRMLSLRDNVAYELNGSSDVTLGRLFWYRKFDAAIVGFLTCVEELVTAITKQDPSFLFPYVIQKDRIGPPPSLLTLRYQFAEEAAWTRALKYMLTTLKYVIAFVSVRKLKTRGEPK